MDQEKEFFKKKIFEILNSLPRICNEKDVKKVYRENEGQNINNTIDKVRVISIKM